MPHKAEMLCGAFFLLAARADERFTIDPFLQLGFNPPGVGYWRGVCGGECPSKVAHDAMKASADSGL